MNASRFDALILDMDGVFVNTEPVHFEAFRQILAPKGVRISDEFLYRLVGEPARKNYLDISRQYQVELDVDEMVVEHEKKYLQLLHTIDVDLLPGVEDLLARAHALKLKVGLCTSSPLIHVRTVLAKVRKNNFAFRKNEHLFHAIVTFDDVQHKKPHPEPYLKACQKLGVSPQKSLVIEDSRAGVEAAKAAGCACFALRSHYNSHMDFSIADHVVDSIEQIVLTGIQ